MTETLPHLTCPACSYHFYHQSTLQLHLRKHHIFTRVATVTRYYTAVARLRTGHMMFHQLEGNCGYVCRTCNKMFQLRGRCMAHVMKVHLRKRTCRKCSQNIGHHRSRLLHRCVCFVIDEWNHMLQTLLCKHAEALWFCICIRESS